MKSKFKVGDEFFKIDDTDTICKYRAENVRKSNGVEYVDAKPLTEYEYDITKSITLKKECFDDEEALYDIFHYTESKNDISEYNNITIIADYEFKKCFDKKKSALKAMVKHNRKMINGYKAEIETVKDLVEFPFNNDITVDAYRFIAYKERCVELLDVYPDIDFY